VVLIRGVGDYVETTPAFLGPLKSVIMKAPAVDHPSTLKTDAGGEIKGSHTLTIDPNLRNIPPPGLDLNLLADIRSPQLVIVQAESGSAWSVAFNYSTLAFLPLSQVQRPPEIWIARLALFEVSISEQIIREGDCAQKKHWQNQHHK